MNKELSKTLFRAGGVPTPESVTVRRGETAEPFFGFPCVVKPCSGGSSVGTSIVETEADYPKALEEAFRYEDAVLVERYVRGRELTVGVLDGEAMPVIEIIPKSGFYDYRNKYQAGLTEELCPAPITPEQTAEVQALALRASDLLMIDVYSRMDFLLDERTGVFFCLEANTLPGMTPTSLVPRMGKEMGLPFSEICERIIAASLKKYEAQP
jgi:D-alanine-D-alanine ligase